MTTNLFLDSDEVKRKDKYHVFYIVVQW